MASLFQTNTVRAKTARMTHRYSLRFEGLQGILETAKNRNQAQDAYTGNDGVTGNRYAHLLGAIGANPVDALELSLLSVSVPSIELEMVDAWRFQDSVKHVTRFAPMGDMTVTFYDYISGSASAIMYIWHGLVGDKRTGAISFKEEYVLPSARLIEFGPKAPAQTEGSEDRFAEHVLVNLFPKTIELGEHSYENGEIRKVTVQFGLEGIYPDYYKSLNVR